VWEGRTIEAHRAQIREMTRIREFHRADEEALLDWRFTLDFTQRIPLSLTKIA